MVNSSPVETNQEEHRNEVHLERIITVKDDLQMKRVTGGEIPGIHIQLTYSTCSRQSDCRIKQIHH